MRRRRKSFGDEDAAVDMTPMLDIVFIMLIFFIVTATFLNESGLDFTRPRDNAAPSDPDPKPAIQVYISEENTCSVDEMSTLCTDVVDRVVGQLANKPGASVILRIHEYSSHQVQIALIDGFIRRELKTKKEVITANGETR